MKKLVLDDREIKNLTSKICRDIVGSRWHPDYIVGITRGGLTPAVMISHWFDVPCETLKVSLRDGGESESNLWMAEQAFGYVPADDREFTEGEKFSKENRKNILIVDDINDTGATINWILKDWSSGCLPNETAAWERVWGNNVRFAVLVDNSASECCIGIDYSGMKINKAEDDAWIEFPWEMWWAK